MIHRTSRLLAVSVVMLAGPAAAQRPVQLPAFSSIELRNSVHAVLRPGPAQRVTLLKGSLEYTQVEVADGGVLVIQKCRTKCPRGYELEVEIALPNISRITLAHGGWIQSLGSFAPQTDLAVAVRHGGTVDVRSMTVDRVAASVEQGGRILTVPRGRLSASVTQGGVITYWGNAQVTQSVEHGGDVGKGRAEDLNVPLFDLAPSFRRAVDPVHPVRSLRDKHRSTRH